MVQLATEAVEKTRAVKLIVLDRDGRFLDAWGEGVFTNAHGICIGPDDTVYLADNMDHTVRVFRPDGTLVRTLGQAGVASDTGFVAWTNPVERAAGPFNMVTNAAPGPDGRLYTAEDLEGHRWMFQQS